MDITSIAYSLFLAFKDVWDMLDTIYIISGTVSLLQVFVAVGLISEFVALYTIFYGDKGGD